MKRSLPLTLSLRLATAALALLLVSLAPARSFAQAAPGSLDPAYPNPATDQPVQVVIAQTVNGETKAIIGGSFSSLLDDASTPAPGLARFNADGSLDAAFLANVSGAPLAAVTALALEPDGKILVAGRDSTLSVGSNTVLLRFNANGTPDSAFRVTLDDDVESIAFQPGGNILISGLFKTVNGASGPRRLARLSAAGVLDTGFQAFDNNALTITEVKRIAVLPSGGILAVTHVSEGDVDYLIQLDPTNGSVPDAPLFFNLAADGRIYDLNVDGAGRVIVVGNFDGIDNHPRASHIARFGADGQIDNNFVGNEVLPSVLLQSVVVDASGRPLVGGVTFFTSALFRLTADTGAIDSTFSFPLSGEGNYIQSLALEPAANGAVLAAGQFSIGQRSANLVRVILGATGGGPTSDNVTVTVPGASNIWLAGAAAGTTASTGQDNLTNATPFLVGGLTITPGGLLNFSATGSVSNDPAQPVTVGPDGGPYLGSTIYSHIVENNIASLTAPINSLIGVFLDDSVPAGDAPGGLDFSGNGVAGGVDYANIAPALRQPFFIGNGTNASGDTQTVTVPAGATRLYLGSLDPSDQENNLGSFSVAVATGAGAGPGPGGTLVSLPLTTGSENKLDLGVFNPGVALTLTFTGTGDLIDSRFQVKPDGSLAAPATDAYTYANNGSPYPVINGGDGINHFSGGGANYDNVSGGYSFAGSTLTDTTQPATSLTATVIRLGTVVGTFSASPGRGDWFDIGNGATVQVPPGGAHLYVAVADAPGASSDNHGAYTGALSVGGVVGAAPILAVTDASKKSTSDATGATVVPGDALNYSFTVRNTGSADAVNVVVTTNFGGIKFKSATANGVAVVADPKIPQLAFPKFNLAAGASETFTVKAKLAESVPADGRTVGLGFASIVADGTTLSETPGLNSTVLSPYQVSVSGDADVRPGGLLTFHFTAVNKSTNLAPGATVRIAAPANYKVVTATGAVADGTDEVFSLGDLRAGATASFNLTLRVPADIAPGSNLTLLEPVLHLAGGTTGYVSPGITVALSNQPALNPPLIALTKKTVDVYTLVDTLANNRKRALPLVAGLAALDPIYKGLYLPDPSDPSNLIPNLDLVEALALKINPYLGDDSTGSASGGEILTVASPSASKPNPFVTFALFFDNTGSSDVEDIVITDPVPDGFIYDPNLSSDPKAFLAAPVLVNGKPATADNFRLTGKKRTLEFHTGKVKAGKPGLILYQLRLLAPGSGGPSIGAIVSTVRARLDSSSFTSSTYSAPAEGTPLLVTGPFHAFVEPQNNGSYARIGNTVRYTLFYKNDGVKKARNLLVRSNVPAGTTFAHAALLANDGRTERAYTPGSGESSAPLGPDADGNVTFNLGEVKKNRIGFVAVDFTLNAALAAQSKPLVQANFLVGDSDVAGNFVTFGERPGFGTRAVGARPHLLDSDAGAGAPGVSSASTSTRVDDPSVPRLFVIRVAPMAVQAGTDYDQKIVVGNLGDQPVGNASPGGAISAVLPAGVTVTDIFTNDEATNAANKGAQPDGNNRLRIVLPRIMAHAVTVAKITLHVPAGAVNTTLLSPNCAVDGFDGFATLYCGPVKTRVVQDANQLALQAGSITGDALARYGVTNSVAPRLPQNLTFGSRTITYAGADALAFNNGVLLVPLGGGNAVVVGTVNTVSGQSPPPPPAAFTGSEVLFDRADSLFVRNLRSGTNVVVNNNGQSAQTIFRNLLSGAAGNVVHQKVANLNTAGVLNLVAADGKTFVSNEPALPPMPIQLANTLAVGGVAVPAGVANQQLILQGDVPVPTLLANGAVSNIGNRLLSQVGGGVVSNDGGSVVSNDGGSLVSQGGGNLVSQGGGNATGTPLSSTSALLNQDGAGLITNDGAGLITNDGAGLITNDGAGLITNDGAGLIGNEGGR